MEPLPVSLSSGGMSNWWTAVEMSSDVFWKKVQTKSLTRELRGSVTTLP